MFPLQVKNCQLNNQHVASTCFRPKGQNPVSGCAYNEVFLPHNRWHFWQFPKAGTPPGLYLGLLYGLVRPLCPKDILSPAVFAKLASPSCILKDLIKHLMHDLSTSQGRPGLWYAPGSVPGSYFPKLTLWSCDLLWGQRMVSEKAWQFFTCNGNTFFYKR